MNPRVKFAVSSALLISFVLTAFTGFALLFLPHGPGWIVKTETRTFRHTIESLHTIAGLVMACLGIVHFSLNWRIYLSEGGGRR